MLVYYIRKRSWHAFNSAFILKKQHAGAYPYVFQALPQYGAQTMTKTDMGRQKASFSSVVPRFRLVC